MAHTTTTTPAATAHAAHAAHPAHSVHRPPLRVTARHPHRRQGGIVAEHFRRQFPRHQLPDLGYDEHGEPLAFADPSHSERALYVVAKHHVFPQRNRSPRVHDVLDVHARRVDLIVEREATHQRYPALIGRHHTPRRPDKHLLPIVVVEKHDPVAPL